MSSGRCEMCRHFNALRTQCRRYPPKAFVLPGPQGQPITLGTWPPTDKAGWCGEYAAALVTEFGSTETGGVDTEQIDIRP